MKRTYADLHLCPKSKASEHILPLISKASRLGYSLAAVTYTSSLKEEETRQLRSIAADAEIDLATRIDLRPRNPEELIHNLRKLRRKFEIICVICNSKEVSRQAARDRRVDLLNFPSLDYRRRFFDAAEAELASKALASLEIDVKPLLTLEGPTRVRLLSSLRREASIARDYHVPIVLSSGVSEELLMRKPREMAALASLFDLDEELANEAVSTNPVAIVKRNRGKLDADFVAPGIRVIRRGRDCPDG